MICPNCCSYMYYRPDIKKGFRKCPTCGYTCELEAKETIKLDRDQKVLAPSDATKKILGIKEE